MTLFFSVILYICVLFHCNLWAYLLQASVNCTILHIFCHMGQYTYVMLFHPRVHIYIYTWFSCLRIMAQSMFTVFHHQKTNMHTYTCKFGRIITWVASLDKNQMEPMYFQHFPACMLTWQRTMPFPPPCFPDLHLLFSRTEELCVTGHAAMHMNRTLRSWFSVASFLPPCWS